MKQFLIVALFLSCFSLKAQTIPSVMDSIPNPTGSYLDTAYFHILFAAPYLETKVQPARIIVRYITYDNVPSPKAIEQWFEVIAKGNFQDPLSKVKWVKSPYTLQNVIWSERIKKAN